MAKGTFIVIVRRVQGAPYRVPTLRPVGTRLEKPGSLKRDEIAVKLTIEIPDEAFTPLEPAAIIVIPLERTRPPMVEVTGVTKPADAVLENETAETSV